MEELFKRPQPRADHPAAYTDVLLGIFAELLRELPAPKILDPFGGTGKVYLLNRWLPEAQIQAVELEPDWAGYDRRMVNGSALALPFPAGCFDSICTSPTYGNRMADTLIDGLERITYTAKIGRKLHPENSGALQWGKTYRAFHLRAWKEAVRTLRAGGVFILNCKNHIRAGREQHVTEWHIEALQDLGLRVEAQYQVKTPSMRYGQNGGVRVEFESVIKLVKDL